MTLAEKAAYARSWRAINRVHWSQYRAGYGQVHRERINARKRLLSLRDAMRRVVARCGSAIPTANHSDL